MSTSSTTLTHVIALFVASIFLAGCNPGSEGWASLKGKNVSASRVATAKHSCNYNVARSRAVRLLNVGGRKNSRRAARIMGAAERCMKKYGVHYRSHRAYALGQVKHR